MDLEKLLCGIGTSMGSLLVCMFIEMCDGNERIGLDAMREVWKSFAWEMVGEGGRRACLSFHRAFFRTFAPSSFAELIPELSIYQDTLVTNTGRRARFNL